MGFLDWLGQGLSQIGKAINEKIAGFEKATGIDIPFVGIAKEEISKPPTPSPASTQAPSKQIEQAKQYFETGKTVNPFQPQPQQTQQMSIAPKTYRVELGTQPHQKQIEEIKQQVGGGRVVATPEGIAVEFESTSPPKEVKVTPYEEIIKQQEQEKLKQQVSEIYEKASPLEKLGLHAHAFFSEKGLEYLWSYLPGGKSPEDVVKEKMIEAVKTPQEKYVVQTAVGSLVGSPPGIIGTSMLVGAGTGAVIGKVAPTIASKVPVVAKVGQVIAEHPTATKVVTGIALGGIETGKGAVMYKTLEAKGVQKEEIAEKIGAEVSRDVLAMVGFGYGFKYGLEKTLPKPKLEVVGRRAEEKTLKLVAGREEGIPEGKIAQIKIPQTEKFVEAQPTKEWMEAIKKGKIVEETPDYIIKEHKGYEYLISKKPTGLPTQKLGEEGLIDVLRVEKTGYLKLGVAKEGKYAGMEVFVRKGAGIPVTFEQPSGAEEFKPTVFKPSGKPSPILKELAESYKASKLAEDMKLAEKISGTEIQQMRAMEEATKDMLRVKPIEETTKEVTSGGLKLLTETKETGFVPLEPVVSPVALEFVPEPTVSFITPALITPTLIPRTQVTKAREITKQELKVMEKTEKSFKPKPTPIEIEKPEDIFKPTPTIIPKPLKEDTIITQAFKTEEIITPKTEEKLTSKEISKPKPTPIETSIPSSPLPILFPELPKGSVSKATLEDLRMFKQMTKYEPSLLGILLGKKRKGEQEFFTGFEIRGI
jgi:hypothetical protein